jgi:hypothetical protein
MTKQSMRATKTPADRPALPPDAVDVLRGFACIHVPAGAADSTWVAQSVHNHAHVLASQVRRARAILVEHDPTIPEQDGWSPGA